ncbi:hypothetical protein [Bacillus pretiosus]
MDNSKLIYLLAKVVIEASKHGKDHSWMYDTRNYRLDQLCEELNISIEEIQDMVFETK